LIHNALAHDETILLIYLHNQHIITVSLPAISQLRLGHTPHHIPLSHNIYVSTSACIKYNLSILTISFQPIAQLIYTLYSLLTEIIEYYIVHIA
jgi:hypothetical protein